MKTVYEWLDAFGVGPRWLGEHFAAAAVIVVAVALAFAAVASRKKPRG